MSDLNLSADADRAWPDVMDPATAALYLDVPETGVRNLLRAGKLPGARVGRLWRLRRADLDAMFVPVTRTAPQAPPSPSSPASCAASSSLPFPMPRSERAPALGRPGRPRKRGRASRSAK